MLVAVSLALSLLLSTHGIATAGTVGALSVAIPPPLNCKGVAIEPFLAAAPSVRAEMVPNPGDADADLTFCSSVTGISGSYTVNWSFGDGRYSSAPDPVHAYPAAKNFTVIFTLNSTDYNTSLEFLAYVHPALSAVASYTPVSPSPSTVVDFTDSVGNGTAPYVTYWNFGDGTNGTGAEANHTFHRAGTFEVEVTTNDSGGGSVVETLHVTVSSPPSYPGGSTTILIGTSIAAVAVAVVGFAYFQWEKRRRPRPPTPEPPPPASPP